MKDLKHTGKEHILLATMIARIVAFSKVIEYFQAYAPRPFEFTRLMRPVKSQIAL